jgi:hypothetical protein
VLLKIRAYGIKKTIASPLVAQAGSSSNMLTAGKEVIARVGTADMIASTGSSKEMALRREWVDQSKKNGNMTNVKS